MKIDCVSDLHGAYPILEGGDLLIVAGDWTGSDSMEQYVEFFNWVYEQKYAKKVLIAGNHDMLLQNQDYRGPEGVVRYSFPYLQDSGTEFHGLKIWGTPWTKTFLGMNPDCMAFTCDTELQLARKWRQIPLDTDILITHSPPFGVMDQSSSLHRCGSKTLSRRIRDLKNLKLHVFGHIHEGHGHCWQYDETVNAVDPKDPKPFGHQYVNAAIMDENYRPINKPIRIVL